MTVSGLTMIKTSRQFIQSCERRPEESILPTQLRPVNFPVEEGQLLAQGEILCGERGSGHDQASEEPKERVDEDHKCEGNHRKKDGPEDRVEWLMISLTTSNSRRDEIFGMDKYPVRRKMKEEGVSSRAAIVQGSMERLSPILIATLVTGVGPIPLALSEDEPGREIQQPKAVVILERDGRF